MNRVPTMLLLALAACAPSGTLKSDPPDVEDTGIVQPPTDSVPTPPTTDTMTVLVETATPTDTAPELCVLPPAPTAWTYFTGIPVSEDFTFDELGNMVNIDQGPDALFRTPYLGPPEILAPYSSPEVAGVAFTLDGRLALADEGNGALVLLGLDGSTTVLNGSLNQPNSIAVDDQGFIFVTAFDQILRVDPVTGVSTTLITLPGLDLDGLVFAPGFLRLWFNYDEESIVAYLDLDTSGNVLATKTVVQLPQFGGELDGMTMDECGNVYAIETDGSLYRVFPDGTAELLLTLGGVDGMTTSSLHFGSGIGGWEADHLYVINRYGGMFEVEIGIPGRKDPHLP